MTRLWKEGAPGIDHLLYCGGGSALLASYLGHFRDDGKVYLLWTDWDGSVAHGLYTVNDKNELQGHWAYATRCSYDEAAGVLVGSFGNEHLRRQTPMNEGF